MSHLGGRSLLLQRARCNYSTFIQSGHWPPIRRRLKWHWWCALVAGSSCGLALLLMTSSRTVPLDTYIIKEEQDNVLIDWLHSTFLRPFAEEYTTNVPSTFLLEPSTRCTTLTFLMILVESLPSEAQRRRVVRSTWGQAVVASAWHTFIVHEDIKLFFVLGRPRDDLEFQAVKDEAGEHQDIVVADMVDTYRNLTRKTMAGLCWASRNCPQAKFLVKADQDTFVHVPRLLALLHGNEAAFKKAVFGHIIRSPLAQRFGKSAISFRQYPFPWYTSFANGPLYVIDNAVVANIVGMARLLPYLPFEDVFVGSVCKALGVRRIQVQPFLVHERHNTTFCRFADVTSLDIAVTAISLEQIVNIWQVIGRGGVLC